MTDPLIGERWTNPPRYIDHPPAASSELDNGSPFDSDTEMMIRNNCAHLAEESLRQLVTDCQPNQLSKVASLDGWTGLVDEAPAEASWARPIASAISWDPRVANLYGPFPLTIDRTIPSGTGPADGALTIRKVRVRVDCTVTDATTTLYVALTVGDGTSPIEFFGGGADTFGIFQSNTPGAGFAGVKEFDLVCTVPGDQFLRTPMTTRPTATHGATQAAELMGYLWVGVFHPSGIDLWSVTAYEIL